MDGARAQSVTIGPAGGLQACRVCGTMLAGPYCQACGQPRLARAAGLNPFGLSPGQIIVVLVGLVYATLTQRKIYAERWTPAVLKGAVVVAVGAAVHNFMLVVALGLAILVT